MKTLLKLVIIVPLAVALIAFALANRVQVTIALYPLGLIDPPLSFMMPLYLPIFLALIVGVFMGGIAMWFSEGRHRRAARIHLRDLEREKRRNEELERERTLPPLPPSTLIG